MKILITLLKPLSFLPALLMMYIIFSFSAQPGEVSGNLSYKISYEIIETKSELLSENLSSEEIAYKADGIHYYVRKAAHMTEYFLLAIAISFPLYVYGVRGSWLMLLAGICGCPYTCGKGCGNRQYRGVYRNTSCSGILLVCTE